VVAFARRAPKDPRVTPFSGDIRDLDAVTKAMHGADVVVHFAWALEPLPTEAENRAVNIGGTQNVLEAMARTGCERLVFSSSVMAYGSHPDNPDFLKEEDCLRPAPRIYYAAQKAEVEAMIVEAGVAATVSRPAIALGHDTVSYAGRLFGMPLLAAVRGVDTRWQLIHTEDVARFHAEACFSKRTGVVNLAASGVLSSKEFATELHRVVLNLPRRVMDGALRFSWEHDILNIEPETLDGLIWPPVADTTRLEEEWGFRCGWSGREAAAAAGRIFGRSVYLGARRVDAPWRMRWAPTKVAADLPPADGGELRDPAPPGHGGEFDALIDPRYPIYSAANLSEAFPGPMSPLSLDVALSAIRGAGTATAELVGVDDAERVELGARPIASFGHRLYVNVSVLRAMAAAMPGWSADDIDRQYLGSADFTATPAGPPAPSSLLGTVKRTGGVLARMLPAVLAVRGEADELRRESDRLRTEIESVADITDERLLALLSLARDLAVQAWNVSSFAAAASGNAVTLAGDEGAARSSTADDDLVSGAILRHVHGLAELLRTVPALQTLGRTASLSEVQAASPEFAKAFEVAIVDVGHRGPGEGELANLMFEQRPDALLSAAWAAVTRPVTTHSTKVRRSVRSKVARKMLHDREYARDVSVRATHNLRLLATERGRRLTSAGVIGSPQDAFALTFDELSSGRTANVGALVQARWAERDRLARLTLPPIFESVWEPVEVETRFDVGDVLRGAGASKGVVTGRARIIDSAFDSDLEPGDILVAHVTDTGWTAYFAGAAAVVTDVGALVSHAAIVAREFEIPCVVATHVATTCIKDGMQLEVDGGAGTVTRLE
jgi:nucleoside-diphosphate-sugar epimerase/phosphohistidine swiveling domain-containing protein